MIRIWNEINKANKTGNGVQLIGTSFIPVPLKRRCEDGPIKILHQLQPNTFISPLPTRLSCTGLYCKDFDCLVRKKKTICWWGLQYVIRKTRNRFVSVPLGIKRVCYETHIECGCRKCQDFTTPEQCIKPCPNLRFSNLETKCYWAYPKQVKSDPTTKVLSRGECSCCYPQECIPPLVFSYETCDCECPIVCGNGFILNEKKCSCECDLDQVCPPPKVLDPEKCICKCPFGSIEDQATGDCIGQCDQFSGSDNCEKIFCVEDPTKHCVLTNGKCECPTSVSSCTEIKDSATCNKTVCPGTNSSMCKYVTTQFYIMPFHYAFWPGFITMLIHPLDKRVVSVVVMMTIIMMAAAKESHLHHQEQIAVHTTCLDPKNAMLYGIVLVSGYVHART